MENMRYHDDQEVRLADRVAIEMKGHWPEAVVVMLGDSLEHLEMDADALDWYQNKGGVDRDHVVIQWLEDDKPDPGAYMSTDLCCVVLKARAGGQTI